MCGCVHAHALSLQRRPTLPQALPPGGRLVSLERELSWVLVAKRFVSQAGGGSGPKEGQGEALSDKVGGPLWGMERLGGPSHEGR
jgi:hypothetical protein